MSKIITVEVIKSHDGIQRGAVLRHAESPLLDYMVDNGYYKVLSSEESDPANITKKTTTRKKSSKK